MPRRSTQRNHCKKIANYNHKKPPNPPPPNKLCEANPNMMVLSGIMEGTGYEAQKRTSLRYGLKPVSKSTYFRRQANILPIISKVVNDDCEKYAEKIKPGAPLAIDAAWNHPRHGSSATISMIDLEQDKVVAAISLSKEKGQFQGNYIGSSNNMESQGISKVLDKVSNSIREKNVKIAHDNDNRTSKILKNVGYDIQESLDLGHAQQELKRKAKKHFQECARNLYQRECKNPDPRVKRMNNNIEKTAPKRKFFNEGKITLLKCQQVFVILIQHLISFFTYLIKNIINRDEREKQWINATNHFLGDHKECNHPSDNEHKKGRPRTHKASTNYWEWEEGKKDSVLKDNLDVFLENTIPLIRRTVLYRTQANESLNKNISKKRPKNSTFFSSNEARALAAIGQKNDSHFETNLLMKYFPNEIPFCNIERLRKDEDERVKKNQKRNSDHERNRKNKARSIERSKHKEIPGEYKSKKSKLPLSS